MIKTRELCFAILIQPLEAKRKITRKCLEILASLKLPVAILTQEEKIG